MKIIDLLIRIVPFSSSCTFRRTWTVIYDPQDIFPGQRTSCIINVRIDQGVFIIQVLYGQG